MTKKERERAEAIEELRKILKPGDTVYTSLIHCARSGMMRVLDLRVIRDNAPWRITGYAADAIGARYNRRHDGLEVGGCGMDMGFHAVYNLSRSLWPAGFDCISENCPSNDHSNGDRERSPHPHHDGGYALRHRWM